MRSSQLIVAMIVPVGLACASSNAGKVCDPVASWNAPAYRCVAPATEVKADPIPAVATLVKAAIKDNKIELKETVEFKVDSDELANVTDSVLDEVVTIMKEHPEITRIRIEGHTDSTGSRQHNLKLSEARARTVKNYLASHGIEAGRMSSVGLGQTRPIADNKTEEGRAKNRRVEIQIEEKK
jgi:outer membrane protein OmpA-like peptidoglycan-associated protein